MEEGERSRRGPDRWIEECLSGNNLTLVKHLRTLLEWARGPALDGLAALAAIINSRRLFRTELDQYLGSRGRPVLARKHTDGTVQYYRRICDLADLVKLPVDRDPRRAVAEAIREDVLAFHDARDFWFDRVMHGLR